jgi:hypothetical protein
MLNGSCPVIVFQKTDLNKVSVAGSVYLDEDLTGLALMSQNGRVELASDSIAVSKGKGPVSKSDTFKIKQRCITNGVDIVLKASRNSMGLNALLPLIDTAFQKAATGEYFVSYFNRNVVLFKSKLASFSTNESPYDTSVIINISLIKEDMLKESKEEKKHNVALPKIGDKTKPDLTSQVHNQANALINKGGDVLKKAHVVIDKIASSLSQVHDQAKEFIKKGSNALADANVTIDNAVKTLNEIKDGLVKRASDAIDTAIENIDKIKVPLQQAPTPAPAPTPTSAPTPTPAPAPSPASAPAPVPAQAQAQQASASAPTPASTSAQAQVQAQVQEALSKIKKQMIEALKNAKTLIDSIDNNLKAATDQVLGKTKESIKKGSDVLNKADGVIDKAKGFIDKEFIKKGSDVLNKADGVIDKAKGFIDKVKNAV